MILDKELLIAENLDAVAGTPGVVDTGAKSPGKGEPVMVFVKGSTDLADADGFSVKTSPDGSTFTTVMDVPCDLVGKDMYVTLPSNAETFVTVALSGTPTAGTFTAAIVLDGQTAA